MALFSDFDGTLAPIVPRPHHARLPETARRSLRQLSRRPGVTVGLVSGRAIGDLRPLVGLRGVCYIGSHGEEWMGTDGRLHRRRDIRVLRRIQQMRRELRRKLSRLPGIYVEWKPVSVAVHYRAATPEAARKARREVERDLRNQARGFRLLKGKKMREILPPGKTSKGQAVFAVLARLTRRRKLRPLLLYLGDDVTDETVFQRLRPRDIGIHVGGRARTRARYHLDSPAEVVRFLSRLAEAMK